MALDEEARLMATPESAKEELKECPQTGLQEREFKRSIRSGLVIAAVSTGLWLLASHADRLPQGMLSGFAENLLAEVANSRSGFFFLAGLGVALAALGSLCTLAGRFGERAQMILGAALFVCIIVACFIAGATLVATMLALFIVLPNADPRIVDFVSEMPFGGFLFVIHLEPGFVLVVGDLVLVLMAVVVSVTFFYRNVSKPAELAPTLIEHVFTSAKIAFFGSFATTMAVFFGLGLIFVVRAIQTGRLPAFAIAILAIGPAINLLFSVLLAKEAWTHLRPLVITRNP